MYCEKYQSIKESIIKKYPCGDRSCLQDLVTVPLFNEQRQYFNNYLTYYNLQ